VANSFMHLRILLPYRIFADLPEVYSITAGTAQGSYGFLPNRLDCVVPVVPGILEYRNRYESVYVAVDQGILVKTGMEVVVSVRNAIGGADLGGLRHAAEQEFKNLDDRERNVRSTLDRIESSFIRRYMELHRE
jgi:F-type H+-transporting ATPase subunit epsilon